ASTTYRRDLLGAYVEELATALDLDAVANAGLALGVDPLGGASVEYWPRIAERFGVKLTVVNPVVDARFAFMPLDRDGKIRMDCSSPYAIHKLGELRDRFDVAFGTDPDADRHGIVVRSIGLIDPNRYLAVAIDYLFRSQNRPGWPSRLAVGKTVVSSALIDRVARALGRSLVEVPVGFKWFVPGLLAGELGFAGEESAGASFVRKDGSVWTTDKDGILLCLLAAEITARTGRDPGEHVARLEREHGVPHYRRIDVPATKEERERLGRLTAGSTGESTLAGDPVRRRWTEAPAGGAIGGLKVESDRGWAAARPSGTEQVYKIYAESFVSEEHLERIIADMQAIVARALRSTHA